MTQNEQEEEAACLTHPATEQGHQGRAGLGCTDKRVDLSGKDLGLSAKVTLPDLPASG